MIGTRNHSETIKKDLQSSAEFRRDLLIETFNCMLEGDLETGKIVLREYINGTIGFVALGGALGKSPKSLMRMLGPKGNPTARNLFDMVAHLLKAEGGRLRAKFVRDAVSAKVAA
jgi:hypothetical protein